MIKEIYFSYFLKITLNIVRMTFQNTMPARMPFKYSRKKPALNPQFNTAFRQTRVHINRSSQNLRKKHKQKLLLYKLIQIRNSQIRTLPADNSNALVFRKR